MPENFGNVRSDPTFHAIMRHAIFHGFRRRTDAGLNDGKQRRLQRRLTG
ncbi:hypothetical protein [Jannaschia sp. CCS1]|nr:hypothetical protein [Jannaschia sp. CCS1]